MSYDNSQLARVHLHAWQVTGNDFFRSITEEILDYVVREMMYIRPALTEARRVLYEVREERVHPGRDEKVLTPWYGLMLAAFA